MSQLGQVRPLSCGWGRGDRQKEKDFRCKLITLFFSDHDTSTAKTERLVEGTAELDSDAQELELDRN